MLRRVKRLDTDRNQHVSIVSQPNLDLRLCIEACKTTATTWAPASEPSSSRSEHGNQSSEVSWGAGEDEGDPAGVTLENHQQQPCQSRYLRTEPHVCLRPGRRRIFPSFLFLIKATDLILKSLVLPAVILKCRPGERLKKKNMLLQITVQISGRYFSLCLPPRLSIQSRHVKLTHSHTERRGGKHHLWKTPFIYRH